MTVYAVQPEEMPVWERLQKRYPLELVLTTEKPGLHNTELLQGADAVNVVSDVVITREIWAEWHRAGIRAAVTRTIGDEHMNRAIGQEYGIPVFRIQYSPSSVADYAIMMMLMVLRNVKPMMQRYVGGDYTVSGLLGRELPNMTVGILGAGRIGTVTAKHLQGFGCRVCYWNRTPREGIPAEYLPLDRLLSESDILSLHLSANKDTLHFIDREKIARMKPGAILINTARGPLVDTDALIEALESGHLSGAGLDVFDGDREIYYRDFKNKMTAHHQMAILNAMPQVLMLPHMAYYTDQAVEDMVTNSALAVLEYFQMRREI